MSEEEMEGVEGADSRFGDTGGGGGERECQRPWSGC